MTDNLTPKQEAFCLRYIETGNATEAYRLSYDAEDMKPASISRKAFELLENVKITAYIAELKARQIKRHDVTIDRVIAEYAKLAFLDIRKAFDENGNLKPIHELDDDTAAAVSGLEVDKKVSKMADENGEPMVESYLHKIKLSDKKGALDSLAKTLGMFSDGNVNVNVNTQPLPEKDQSLLAEYAKAD
jgi:phage terminase small subunit